METPAIDLQWQTGSLQESTKCSSVLYFVGLFLASLQRTNNSVETLEILRVIKYLTLNQSFNKIDENIFWGQLIMKKLSSILYKITTKQSIIGKFGESSMNLKKTEQMKWNQDFAEES